jgi:hypothetical protein
VGEAGITAGRSFLLPTQYRDHNKEEKNMIRSKFPLATAALLSALLVSLTSAARDLSPRLVNLPDGTPVRLALDESLSSATSQVGDQIHFAVTEDVRANGAIVIPQSTEAVGHVVEAEPKKRLGRGGKLNFSVDYIKLVSGMNVKVRASATREGKDKTGKVIVGTVLVSPLFLLMHGKDVNIPQGTTFTAYVDGDANLTAASAPGFSAAQLSGSSPGFRSAAAAGALESIPDSAEAQAALAVDPATVILKSEPAGADITLDGNYVGSTPSSLRINPGQHSLTISKSGFQTWQRNLNVTAGGSITIDPTLERN